MRRIVSQIVIPEITREATLDEVAEAIRLRLAKVDEENDQHDFDYWRYGAMNELYERYSNGERSDDLYEAMIGYFE